MAPITTGNHPAALWPGVHAFWGLAYKEHPLEYKQLFETASSAKNYEEDVEVTSFGLAPVKNQGAGVTYDGHSQGATRRYTHLVYGLGFVVTQEEQEDNLYKQKAFQRAKALSFSVRQTLETVGANVYNRGFNSGYVGADGKELLATDHPTLSGNQSNELATPADLSEASLEDLAIQIMEARNSRGLKISLMPKCLVIPPSLAFEAERIIQSTARAGTDYNDLNAFRSMGIFPDGIKVNHYFTDAKAYFIKTNAPNGMRHFERRGVDFTRDNDFDTSNAKAKSTVRCSFGWTDWRALYGSPGA